jgi:hypothetical protein
MDGLVILIVRAYKRICINCRTVGNVRRIRAPVRPTDRAGEPILLFVLAK